MFISISELVMTISIVPSFIALLLSFHSYMQTKYRYLLDISLAWFFLSLGNLILTFAYFTMDLLIYRLGVLVTIPFTYSLLSLVDSVTKEQLDPTKLVIITFINSGVFFTAFLPDSVRINTTYSGDVTPALSGWFLIFGSLTFFYASLAWLYSMYRVYKASPPQLKKHALINLLGASLAGPGSALVFITGIVWYTPGIDYVLIGLGALISTIAMTKEKKLGYVLTFEVTDLLVINNIANIPLYHYQWVPTQLNSVLFSGAIAAISSVFKEAINKGSIQEIKLEQGILIIHHNDNEPFTYVLVSSRSSKTLRDALNLFATMFKESLNLGSHKENTQLSLTNEQTDAFQIVEAAFPFIPTRHQ